MFAYDEGWSRRINQAIDSGLTAEAAIERVQQRMRARMQEIDDPLLPRGLGGRYGDAHP
jgi:phosphotransferase system enzyme I (PtsP)